MKYFIVIFGILLLLPLMAVTVLTEDFESAAIPNGWTQEYVTGEVNWGVHNGGQNNHPDNAHSGNFNAWFFDASEEGYTTRLISPELALTTHSKLHFWYAMDDWVNYQDFFRVYYRTAPEEDWILLQSFDESIMDWEECLLDLPEPTSTYSICFEGEAYWGYGICIDDIVIEDCVMSVLVWDNDNNSHYVDPQSGLSVTCETSITQSLDALNIVYDLETVLPSRLDNYDLILIELGLYCVG
ncbi:MAG: choice-of-anchor J domain-containing protein [Candidatus Cloacimonetes bacterium]|nr:choice-of-anchor J domain-containing protein [Candidatus Cloacimonadota bacterium]